MSNYCKKCLTKRNLLNDFSGCITCVRRKKIKTSWYTLTLFVIGVLLLSGMFYIEIWAYTSYGSCPEVTETRICGVLIEEEQNYWNDYCGAFPDKCIY